MKNEREQCNQCPDKYCINFLSKIGRVRVEIDKHSVPNRGNVIDVSETLIEDCPIRDKGVKNKWKQLN